MPDLGTVERVKGFPAAYRLRAELNACGRGAFMTRVTAALVAVGLALGVVSTSAETAPYVPTHETDCTDTGITTEFGGPVLNCDGVLIYQDMDGQPIVNPAGNPTYAPGTWVTLEVK